MEQPLDCVGHFDDEGTVIRTHAASLRPSPVRQDSRAEPQGSSLATTLNASPAVTQLLRQGAGLNQGVVQRLPVDDRAPFVEEMEQQATERGFEGEALRVRASAKMIAVTAPDLATARGKMEVEFARIRLGLQVAQGEEEARLHGEQQKQLGNPLAADEQRQRERGVANGVAGEFETSVEEVADLYVRPFVDAKGALPEGFAAAVTHWAELGARDVEPIMTESVGQALVTNTNKQGKFIEQIDRYISANMDFGRFFGQGHEEAKKYIHFIWSGRPISKAAMANILQWSKRAEGTPWTVVMWTDAKISNWVESAPLLERAGVQLSEATKVLDPRFAPAYQFARKYNLAGASDLVRLSALQHFGGMYVDVDIGPGSVDLNKVELPGPLDRPLLAPGVRDAGQVREILGLAKEIPITKEHVTEAVRRQRQGGVPNNNFILSGVNAMALNPVINHIAKGANKLGEDWEGSGGFIAGVTGPTVIGGALNRMVSKGQLPQGRPSDTITDLPLEWLTPESENQDWSHKK